MRREYGEAVVNGVASHHNDVPPIGPLGILVGAADAISASRPGARSESMTTYLKRVEDLEKIACSFSGVEKAYAVDLTLIRSMTSRTPLTIKAGKRIIREVFKEDADLDTETCRRLILDCFESDDYAEGRTAFMEKRKPVFKGK